MSVKNLNQAGSWSAFCMTAVAASAKSPAICWTKARARASLRDQTTGKGAQFDEGDLREGLAKRFRRELLPSGPWADWRGDTDRSFWFVRGSRLELLGHKLARISGRGLEG